MKNTSYFPFERNKYFYGKLLSVDDFELEQRYMNDKRRMLNRFLFGTGVVAGLCVVRVDEQTVSVESGFALDAWGREMVVDVPVIRKLSGIEGFDSCCARDSDSVYLCLEYDEQETEQVHNITGTVSNGKGQGDFSFNKVREGYRLYLTDCGPEGDAVSPADWYQSSQIVYQEGDIRITQVMPRYIQAGGTSEIKVQVENLGRSNLSFSYELVLNRLLSRGKARVKVSFDEMLFERTGQYETSYPIEASGPVQEEGTAVLDSDSVRFRLSDMEQDVHMKGKMTADIVSGDEKEAVRRAYYQTPMGKLAENGCRPPVFLARIHLVRATDTYIIEKIENVPFGQYVSNHTMNEALYQMMQKELFLSSHEQGRGNDSGGGNPAEKKEMVKISRGVTEISLKGGGQRGDKFFSAETVHGLGLGAVTVVLGLEKESGKVVYGSSEIFESAEEKGADAELAACVNEEDGTFLIGARLISGVTGGVIRVRWTALRDGEETLQEKNEKRIFIQPNLLELTVRQSYRLEAVCENMVEKAVLWSVRDEGGFIDGEGMYTAPNTAGVYEVVAQSAAFPEIQASVFIVVRDVD